MARQKKKKSPSKGSAGVIKGKQIQKLKKRLKKDPADEGAFVKLWDAFLESESWEAMIEILQMRIDAVSDTRDKVRALIRLGNLYDEKLGDPSRAVDAYGRVLTIDPKNRRAIWSLGMLYHDLEDWEKVIEIYLLQIDLAETPEEKLGIRAQLAQIYEQCLQQEDQALMEYIRAARLAPQTVRILLNMEKLATRTESFRELLAVYEDVVERIERIELRIALYLKLARLYSEHVSDEEQAAGYYKRAIELSGGEAEKLFSISAIYGEEEEWEELISTYTQLIGYAHDPDVKSMLRREISRLYREGLKDPTSAFFELVRVARYSPDSPGLVDELVELGVDCEKHLELAAVLEDIGTRLQDDDAKANLYTRLARLHLDELHNAQLAQTAISQAIEISPAYTPAQLVRFDLLQTNKEFETLVEAIESFLSRPDLPPDVAQSQRKRLAQIYEQKLGDRERAVQLYRESMQSLPTDGAPPPEEREEILEELYRRQGVWDELISLLASRLAEASDPEDISRVALEIADIQENRMDRVDLAFFELIRAIKQVPGDAVLIGELFRLAGKGGFETELLAVLDEQARSLENRQAADYHHRAATLLAAGGDDEGAIDRLSLAIELDPAQKEAYAALKDVFQGKEDFEALADLHLKRASVIEAGEEKIELLYEAAELLEERIGNDVRAADVYDRILGLQPGATAASKAISRLRGEAAQIASFEKEPADEQTDAVGPDEPHEAPSDAAVVEQAEEPAGPSEETEEVDMAEVASPVAPVKPDSDEEEVAEVTSPLPTRDSQDDEVAEIYSPPPDAEDEDDVDTAVSASPAAEGEPDPEMADPFSDREPTLVEPAPQAEAGDEEEEIAREPTMVDGPPETGEAAGEPGEQTPVEPEALEPQALEPPPERVDEREEEEDIDTGPMEEESTVPREPEDPLTSMHRALLDNPDDVDGWIELSAAVDESKGGEAAFDILEESLGKISGEENRAKLYRRMSLLAKPARLQMRLGKLLEDQDRPEDAESSYRSVLREDPAHDGALDGLQRIYQARGALDRYDAILTRTLKAATNPPTRRNLLLRRAKLRAEMLDRESEALEDLEQLTSVEGGDLEALSIQEGILERTDRLEDLVSAYEKHLDLCDDPSTRMDLHSALAILYETHLQNPDRAIHYYRKALEDDPGHIGAYDSLASLLTAKRDWLGAIEILDKASKHVEDAGIVSQLHYRAGKILEEQLLRPEEAEAAYRRAIENESPSADALGALKDMARRREDWVEVIRLGKQQSSHYDEPSARATVLVELARIWRDKLDNQPKALQFYEMAHDLDPDNLEAARSVADARLRTRSHEEAHVLLEHVARIGAAGDMEKDELAAVHLKLAQTAEALDRPGDASEAYERAIELAPADHKILTQYGYHLARRERWDRAVELYGEILDRYRHLLEPNEVADIHCLAARGWVELEKPEEATTHYRKALKANPRHLPALRANVNLARKLGRNHEVVELLARLKDLSSSPSSRFKMSVQIGDLLSGQLDRPEEAAEAYREALEQEPNNVELLEKLRKVLVHAERYSEAVEALERLAHVSSNKRQRARYLRIAGDILGERLDDDKGALELYLRALNSAPLDKRAHGSAVKILNRIRDWPRLTSLYEGLLKRLPPPISGSEDRRISILTELIELYRYRLDDSQQAISACEQLLKIKPSDIKVREDLARLYEFVGRLDDSVRIHRSLIADSPFSVDSYHALRRIYELRGQTDRTLCMAATLNFLDEANEDEQALLKEHKHALPIPPGRRIDEALYNRKLLFPLARGLLGDMFTFISDFARPLFVTDLKEFRLKTRDRFDLRSSNSKVSSAFSEALQMLGVPEPEFYGKGANIKGIMAVNTSPPAVLYSEEAVRRASIAELRFMAGRAIAFTRPENLLAACLSPKQLRELLEAMVEIVFPGEHIHPVGAGVGDLARRLSREIPGNRQKRLRQLAADYRKRAEELSIREWLEGIEHTCNRAGFVLCGDLEAAVQVLKGARVVSPSGSNRSLIRELIFYSISDDYFELRKALDASIR